MQTESRALAVFGTIGLVFVVGVLVVPRLGRGETGIGALPVVQRATPEAPPQVQPDVPRLLQMPSLSKTQIAFAFAGEIWTVPREGGTARRLITGQHANGRPIFSPDGTQIAFTGMYDGNTDVYVVPATGGEPRRLTYHPGPDIAAGWTPDGSRVVIVSTRTTARDLPKLFTVAATGGMPEPLPLPSSGTWASYSPDGTHLAYAPFIQWQAAWKRYRGGQASQIWLADLATSKVTKVPRETANDRWPMWVGNTIFFLSDRDGQVGLYAYDVGGDKVRMVAKDGSGFDYRSASAGPGGIVVERLGQIAIVDPASGAVKPVPIAIGDDLPEARPHVAKLEPDDILHATLSPTGKRVLVEAHGEILSVPVEKGDVRNLTQTPAIADRDPVWSPDGKWIAWLSDRGGEYALYFMTPDGLGPMHVVKLPDPSFFYTPKWSPDSKKLVLADKHTNLWLVDVEHPTPVKVDADRYDGGYLDAAWSPDSRWLVYAKTLANHMHALYVYAVADKQIHQITDGRSDAASPHFDRGGKYVWFLASTDDGPAIGGIDMTGMGRATTSSVYAVVLKKTEPSPMAPESDEESAGSAAGAGAGAPKLDAKPEPVVIDFDGIDQRVVALPVDRANYIDLVPGPAGTFFVASAPTALADEDYLEFNEMNPPPIEVSRFDLKARKAERFLDRIDPTSATNGGKATLQVSADGSKLLYSVGKRWFVVASDHAPKPGEGAIKLAGLDVWVDPRAEWRQMYHEVWRIERDFLYDPKAHGLDLAAAEKTYAPFVDGLASRGDLDRLFEEMLGNLVLGHVFVNGPDPHQDPVSVGLLGADFTIENGHYRIAKIYKGENWNPQLQAPLTQPGVVVKEGEYLIAVNGRPVSTSVAVEAAFLDTAGKQTVLSIAASADGHDVRKVTVVPVGSEGQLRLRAWMEDNHKRVDELSHGRVGYVFVPDTQAGGFMFFNRYFYSQVGKDAVVVDERFNHGGLIADYIIDVLRRAPHFAFHARDGADDIAPAGTIVGPKVMIANEMSGSGGDALPWLFKRAKLGPLVGTRTWGGLVGISGYPPLIDGGMITAPRVGLYSPEGKYDVENIGVAPDVAVEQDPELVRQGHDPQLERAVQLALDGLAKSPPVKPTPPPYPDYGPRLPKP